MASDLIREIAQIGEFLMAQKDVLPVETWTSMSMNHLSAVRARISALNSLTSAEATEMVEAVRLAHCGPEDKSSFCEAISKRLTELQTSPKKARKENQVCPGFYNFFSQQDRQVLQDATASQTTKLTQVVSRCCKIGLMWPGEQTIAT